MLNPSKSTWQSVGKGMAKYSIKITKTAQKQLDKLAQQVADTLIEVILSLALNPRPVGYIKLKGRNAYRVRKNNYRIIYEIMDNVLIVTIITIGHRKEIYRK